jgi:pimeloyl-ACP methyl ester carboxylesterase
MKVYFISGLAADARVFKYIRLPEGFEAVHLDWIQPVKDETLPAYALRLADKIDTTVPFALVGLSFGGMLATEIAKQYQPAATILISSIPVSNQLPVYFKWAAKLRLHKIIPISFIKTSSAAKRLITREKSDDKKLLWQIINESDNNLIRWSMGAILTWQNSVVPQPVWHIHGTRDEVLPVRFTQPTQIVPKGSHLLVMTSPDVVNQFLESALLKVNGES